MPTPHRYLRCGDPRSPLLGSRSDATVHSHYMMMMTIFMRSPPQHQQNAPNGKSKIITFQRLNGSVKEPNMFHNYETEKITRKASDAAENLQLYRVARFFHPRSSCRMHLMLFSERPPIYSSCMSISGGRTKQHVIIGFRELAAVDLNT